MKYTEEELLKLELHQRVMTINELLEGSSLKKLLLNDVAVSKGKLKQKLKQLLKPYEYNADTKQFELPQVTETSDNELQSESQDNSVFELLCDIKNLMQTSVDYQRENNEFMLQLVTDKVTTIEYDEVRLYKTLKGDKCDIKNLMQTSVDYQRENNEFMLQLVTDKVTTIEYDEVRLYKTLKGDKLVTRSFKIYDSINERLKLATKSSDLNQQQLFNTLIDKALRELGF